MSARFEFAATAAFGLEGVVARELRRLGYEDAKGFQGGATFSGTLLDAFRANLWLRTADRVLEMECRAFGRFSAAEREEYLRLFGQHIAHLKRETAEDAL